jgi:hypothetical protein
VGEVAILDPIFPTRPHFIASVTNLLPSDGHGAEPYHVTLYVYNSRLGRLMTDYRH